MHYKSQKLRMLMLLVCPCFLLLALGSLFLFNPTLLAYAQTPTKNIAASPSVIPTLKPTTTTELTPTTIVISQPISYTDPSSVISIVGIIVQAITLFFIVKYVIDTASMAKATKDSAKATKEAAEAAEKTLLEMKRTREEENAPFVVVYFNYVHANLTLYLVIENIGKSVARNIKLDFRPPLQASKFNRLEIENNTLIKNGIQSIVPHYKIPIPFDYLEHYFREGLPTEYNVKVTYYGSDLETVQELEYVLDLSYYKYTHFVTEKGLNEIDATLRDIAGDFRSLMFHRESTNHILAELSNAIDRGIIIRNHIPVNHNPIDIQSKLKEFVFLWTISYGKSKDKLNKPFLFGLRARFVLIAEEMLKFGIENVSEELSAKAKGVTAKIFELGNIELVLDGRIVAHSARGYSIEHFNDLGDSIIEDIKELFDKLIAGSQEQPLTNGRTIIPPVEEIPISANERAEKEEEPTTDSKFDN